MKVIFRRFKSGGDIIALFPEEPGNRQHWTCESYQHQGQHSTATVDLMRITVKATPEEYADLYAELESIGYTDLVVVERFHKVDEQARKEKINAVG